MTLDMGLVNLLQNELGAIVLLPGTQDYELFESVKDSSDPIELANDLNLKQTKSLFFPNQSEEWIKNNILYPYRRKLERRASGDGIVVYATGSGTRWHIHRQRFKEFLSKETFL